MTTIHYPVKGRKLNELLTQNTLDMLMAQWENWQQGPGVIGRLHLHSCWGTASVLDRGYQGETIQTVATQMRIPRILYEKTGNPKWRVMENAMASHLLYLQDESGGFIHSSAEFEPTFDTRGCPIHFFFPIIGLCEYYAWEHADASIKALIPDAVNRHWDYMVRNIWQIGCDNRFLNRRPLPFPGWCGVTNQDLVAVGALALCMKTFGYTQRYEQYGKPVLDHYLSPAFYYKDMGLFERGDGINFAERTVYYDIILEMLHLVYSVTKEQRLMDVYDNVAAHLFDAAFTGEDGLTYLARGAITDPKDKSKVYGWEYGAIAFSGYPALMMHMQAYLTRHPDGKKQQILAQLEDTVAAYLFADGSLPLGIFNPNPLFSVAGNPDSGSWITFVLNRLGDRVADPAPVKLPAIHRIHKNLAWKQNGRYWSIEEEGVRKYAGFSRYPAGIVAGEGEPVAGSFDLLNQTEITEIID